MYKTVILDSFMCHDSILYIAAYIENVYTAQIITGGAIIS